VPAYRQTAHRAGDQVGLGASLMRRADMAEIKRAEKASVAIPRSIDRPPDKRRTWVRPAFRRSRPECPPGPARAVRGRSLRTLQSPLPAQSCRLGGRPSGVHSGRGGARGAARRPVAL